MKSRLSWLTPSLTYLNIKHATLRDEPIDMWAELNLEITDRWCCAEDSPPD